MLHKTIERCVGASQPDVLMPDLEDRFVAKLCDQSRLMIRSSVPPSAKADARSVVASKLHQL